MYRAVTESMYLTVKKLVCIYEYIHIYTATSTNESTEVHNPGRDYCTILSYSLASTMSKQGKHYNCKLNNW